MPGARHLKIDLLLPLEQDFPVVDTPGGIHETVRLNQLLTGESVLDL